MSFFIEIKTFRGKTKYLLRERFRDPTSKTNPFEQVRTVGEIKNKDAARNLQEVFDSVEKAQSTQVAHDSRMERKAEEQRATRRPQTTVVNDGPVERKLGFHAEKTSNPRKPQQKRPPEYVSGKERGVRPATPEEKESKE